MSEETQNERSCVEKAKRIALFKLSYNLILLLRHHTHTTFTDCNHSTVYACLLGLTSRILTWPLNVTKSMANASVI